MYSARRGLQAAMPVFRRRCWSLGFSPTGKSVMAHPPRGSAQKERIRFALYCAAVILRRFLLQVAAASLTGKAKRGKGKPLRPSYAAPSVGGDDGMNELDLQTALHVLVNAHMRLTVRVVECPGTELVYVAVVMQQHNPHCFGISGASCVDHRIRQRLPAFENGLFHSRQPPFGMSASNRVRSCLRVLVLCRCTALRDIPMTRPISPSAISSTKQRIKMLCSCWGRSAKAAATSSLSIYRLHPCDENTKLSLG